MKWTDHLNIHHHLTAEIHQEVMLLKDNNLKGSNITQQHLPSSGLRRAASNVIFDAEEQPKLHQKKMTSYASIKLTEEQLFEECDKHLFLHVADKNIGLSTCKASSSLQDFVDAVVALGKHIEKHGSTRKKYIVPDSKKLKETQIEPFLKSETINMISLLQACIESGALASVAADGYQAEDKYHYVGIMLHFLQSDVDAGKIALRTFA